jgi:hypothetical protein
MRVKAPAASAALDANSMSHVSSIASRSANRRSATTLSHHLSPIFRNRTLHARRCRITIVNGLCVGLMKSRDVVRIPMSSDPWLSSTPAERYRTRISHELF